MSERVAVLLTGYGEVEDYDEFTEYNERSFRLLVSKSIKFPDFAVPLGRVASSVSNARSDAGYERKRLTR